MIAKLSMLESVCHVVLKHLTNSVPFITFVSAGNYFERFVQPDVNDIHTRWIWFFLTLKCLLLHPSRSTTLRCKHVGRSNWMRTVGSSQAASRTLSRSA